jgi:hypothetical protein
VHTAQYLYLLTKSKYCTTCSGQSYFHRIWTTWLLYLVIKYKILFNSFILYNEFSRLINKALLFDFEIPHPCLKKNNTLKGKVVFLIIWACFNNLLFFLLNKFRKFNEKSSCSHKILKGKVSRDWGGLLMVLLDRSEFQCSSGSHLILVLKIIFTFNFLKMVSVRDNMITLIW